jgi:hypothetical protein
MFLLAGVMPGQTTTAADAFNKELPHWLSLGGNYRARFEGYTGGSYKPDTTDAYMLSRFTFGLTIRPVSWLKFYGEGYDARAIGKEPAVPPYQDTWDIHQAYVEIGDSATGMFSVRAGRQEMSFGDQRLIGPSTWSNTEHTFDVVRGTFRYKSVRLDAFAASLVNPVDGTWDHHQQGNNLHGLYGSIEKLIPRATVEPYFMWRLQPRVKNEAGLIANVDEKILGTRIVGKLPLAFDYGTEMVKETGSLGTDHIQAWAGHWVAGYTVQPLWATPRIFGEFNFASGDADAHDGVRGTFDLLYPSGHDKYGLTDQIGWRNLKDIRAGVEIKPRKNLGISLVYNDWFLASATDAMYNSSGTAVFRSAAGTAGTHIGQETDAIGTWVVVKSLTASAGLGHIFPGEFLKKTTPGAAYTYPYISFTYKF